MVTTLEDGSVAAVKERFPAVPAALSLGRDLDEVRRAGGRSTRLSELVPLRRLRACRADWVAMNRRLAATGVLAQCHRAGIKAMIWTVDEDAEIRRWLADPRVTVLITNRPADAVALRASLAAGQASGSSRTVNECGENAMSTCSPSTSRLALRTVTASGRVKEFTASGLSPVTSWTVITPVALASSGPDPGPMGPARIAVDHGQRQPAAPGIGGGGHVEPLEQAEVGHPVRPAVAGPVLVGVGARLGVGVHRDLSQAAAISWNGW